VKLIASTFGGFMVIFIAMRHVDSLGILFYQGIALGAFLSILQLAYARYKRHEALTVSVKDALLTFLLIYAFVFTVPTTVDRSYSVKMIQHLADVGAGLSRDDIDHLYVADFVAHGGVDKRLMEQLATGTIYQQDGRYSLTSKGRMLASIFRSTEVVFDCNR
jgi:hypothetical protein